jgi:FlaA1/EpsC-like NDP-sugar epimerase
VQRHGSEVPADKFSEERQMRFKDQGVLVTGGASGIGEKVVHAFGREGALVAVADRDAMRLRSMSPIRRRWRISLRVPPSGSAASTCW